MSKSKVVDLSSIDTGKACDEGAEIELVHPVTSEPLGQFVRIVGKDSKTFREHIARTSNTERRRTFEAQRKGKPVPIKLFEESYAEGTDLLVSCTLGFRNITFEGKPLEFSEDNARKLYSTLIWVREQVDNAVVDLENFIKS